MAKGYWIGNSEVHDMQEMQRYRAANQEVLKRHGARFVVIGGRQMIVEGEGRSRQAILEFPTYEAAVAAYHDPDYQAALKFRQAGSEGSLLIVEGFEPPTQG